MAERGRFELPVPSQVLPLSRRARSTTLPPLRDCTKFNTECFPHAWDILFTGKDEMKPIPWALAISLCSLAVLAQTPPQRKSAPPVIVKCKNVNGGGCTQREVQALSDAVFAGKSKHEVLVPVKDLALAASDGTLRCAQSDGTICTTAELDIIKEIASGQQLTIRYTASTAK